MFKVCVFYFSHAHRTVVIYRIYGCQNYYYCYCNNSNNNNFSFILLKLFRFCEAPVFFSWQLKTLIILGESFALTHHRYRHYQHHRVHRIIIITIVIMAGLNCRVLRTELTLLIQLKICEMNYKLPHKTQRCERFFYSQLSFVSFQLH